MSSASFSDDNFAPLGSPDDFARKGEIIPGWRTGKRYESSIWSRLLASVEDTAEATSAFEYAIAQCQSVSWSDLSGSDWEAVLHLTADEFEVDETFELELSAEAIACLSRLPVELDVDCWLGLLPLDNEFMPAATRSVVDVRQHDSVGELVRSLRVVNGDDIQDLFVPLVALSLGDPEPMPGTATAIRLDLETNNPELRPHLALDSERIARLGLQDADLKIRLTGHCLDSW